jgi:hypothetical protein
MNNTNLSYEFYYLLRTKIEQEGDIHREPYDLSAVQSPHILQEGIPIDSDKRLFRSETFKAFISSDKSLHAEPLENWLLNLKNSWETIQLHYVEHFTKQGVNALQTKFFCNQALLGVVLLISDARLESHSVTVSLRGVADSRVNKVVFKPDSWLFQVIHTPPENSGVEQMPTPAILARFEPHFQAIQQDKHWQLRLDLYTPQLAPLDMTPNTANPIIAANPIFAVYGLAHGELHDTGDATWPQELQNFLIGREPALVVRILPRLIVRQWQFTQLDFAARQVRQHLQARSCFYNQARLPCSSSRQLSEGLQMMTRLNADATLLLGKLYQATKTLEIHRNNAGRWLRRAHRTSSHWQVVWQHEDETPLLDSFDADKQKLHNHVTYLKGELTYLDGIRQRWYLHFEEQQLAWSERLGSLGSILAFVVAVGAASITAVGLKSTPQDSQGSFLSPLVNIFKELQSEPLIADLTNLLSQPVVYWLLILVFLFPIFWHIGKMFFRKMRCSRIWRWGTVMVLIPPIIWSVSQVIMNL